MNTTKDPNRGIYFYFKAPSNSKVPPRRIPDGQESVELYTGGEVIYQGKTYGRGTIIWYEAGELTAHETPKNNPYSCVAFEFTSHQKRIVPHISRWVDLSTLDLFISKVYFACNSPDRDIDILEHCFRAELLWNAYQSSHSLEENFHSEKLRRTVLHIQRNMNHIQELSELAKICGVSEPHLYYLFRKHLGISPRQYIVKKHLDYAASQLLRSNLPIKHIAKESGFHYIEVFYRLFKKQYGVTPYQYRAGIEKTWS